MPSLLELKEHLLIEEQALWAKGYQKISGIDEAGRGPLAGPVSAACIFIPTHLWIEGINDSKVLTEAKRESLFQLLTEHPDVQYGIGLASEKEIDQINILQATFLAMRRAFDNLPLKSDYVLVDGVQLNLEVPSKKLIKGDARSYLIAAASILAKVTRDRIMLQYDQKWPQYGFKKHKGYGTSLHREALSKYGPCEIHRKTFEPIRSLLIGCGLDER